MQYALTVICIIAVDELQVSCTLISNTAYLYFTLCIIAVECLIIATFELQKSK
ncbi:hypothetical protein NIES22_72600 (plasmid) [Calothrix brevissima NIES-22]|nr:hypothetical protein NIES22_72600 [Calothrix brevissima NIES-22]